MNILLIGPEKEEVVNNRDNNITIVEIDPNKANNWKKQGFNTINTDIFSLPELEQFDEIHMHYILTSGFKEGVRKTKEDINNLIQYLKTKTNKIFISDMFKFNKDNYYYSQFLSYNGYNLDKYKEYCESLYNILKDHKSTEETFSLTGENVKRKTGFHLCFTISD